jgi:hypothetical protein
VVATLSENCHQKLGSAFDDFRVVSAFWHGIDHAKHLENLQPPETFRHRRCHRQQAERTEPGMLISCLDIDILSESCPTSPVI